MSTFLMCPARLRGTRVVDGRMVADGATFVPTMRRGHGGVPGR
ncbi:hypothetical protein [Kitasatospora sp. NPDC098663]